MLSRHTAVIGCNKSQSGFSLMELVAALVVILGIMAATAYYRGRPVSDPTAIDTSLPNIVETASPSAGTNYYLEGAIHRVVHSAGGAYFMVKAPGGRKLFVVGTPGLTGGLAHIADGQVAAMQVQLNMGSSLKASVRVVSPAEPVDVFVYQYLVKTAAPANYVDPEADPVDASEPVAAGGAKEKDDE
jgi:prepilin-type N-terminal cleavage/methylation domain-containing protein